MRSDQISCCHVYVKTACSTATKRATLLAEVLKSSHHLELVQPRSNQDKYLCECLFSSAGSLHSGLQGPPCRHPSRNHKSVDRCACRLSMERVCHGTGHAFVPDIAAAAQQTREEVTMDWRAGAYLIVCDRYRGCCCWEVG